MPTPRPLILSVLLLLGAAAGCAAAEETVTLPLSEYQAILQRLDAMQARMEEMDALRRRVEELERNAVTTDRNGGQVEKTAQMPAQPPAVERDIDNLYSTLDALETKQARNKLNFGAELRMQVDGYKATNYTVVDTARLRALLDAGAQPFEAGQAALTKVDTLHDDSNWNTRFRINMDARLTDSLSFHGRLAMFKNWGDSDAANTDLMLHDWNRAHWPGTSNLWVDRAYLDWIVPGSPIPLALTVGRHPSTEGPPLEFRENRLRQSTYPSLIIDGEADGIVLTLGLEEFTGWKNMGLRFAYGVSYHGTDEDYSGATPFPFLDDNEYGDSDMLAAFLESELPGLPESLMVLSYVRVRDIPLILPADMLPPGIPDTMNLGDMDIWGLHFQVRDLADSGVDLFFSYGGNRSHPSGNTLFGAFGLLSDDGQEPHDGYALYGGLRWTLPVEALNEAKLGLEYNHGSRYWYSMAAATPDLFNKLATRGSVYDIYYIQPVNRYLFFRAGYIHVDYDYTGSGFVNIEPHATDATLDNYYLLMDVRF